VGILADLNLLEWVGLGLRWFHVVVGIGWIGASLYFMWLDAQLERPQPPRPGVEGELWMVHSGGFYRVERRRVGSGEMPRTLHWFKWEAAFTGLSGVLLLALVYHRRGAAYLVDQTVSAISPAAASGLALGVIAAGWLVYDRLWTSSLGAGRARLATAVSWALLLAVAVGLCHVLSGRAAYIHVGATLGVLMVLNVWIRIVPAQRELIAATEAGRAPDDTLAARAKRRSTHNSYVTFPVLFTMFSHHYPMTYGHPLNWLVLVLLVVVGAGIRHAMIRAEHRRRAGAWTWAAVAASVGALVWLTSPSWLASPSGTGAAPPSFDAARRIVEQRCVSCHSAAPTDDVFRIAPSGVTFDTPESIRRHAEGIRLHTVLSRTMPLANKTGMTDEERAVLGRWIEAGARDE
jgi:uncharacterized membrane protein